MSQTESIRLFMPEDIIGDLIIQPSMNFLLLILFSRQRKVLIGHLSFFQEIIQKNNFAKSL